MRRFFSVVLVVGAVTLVACSPSRPAASGTDSTPPVSAAPSAEQVANLADVDTSVTPTGPSVRDLITVEDVKKIIGRDDIVLAVAT